MHRQDIMRQHALWRVDNGESIDRWNDRWGHANINWKDFTDLGLSMVNDFICPDSLRWNVGVLEEVFSRQVC